MLWHISLYIYWQVLFLKVGNLIRCRLLYGIIWYRKIDFKQQKYNCSNIFYCEEEGTISRNDDISLFCLLIQGFIFFWIIRINTEYMVVWKEFLDLLLNTLDPDAYEMKCTPLAI